MWPTVLEWWESGCDPPPPNARKRQLLHETLRFHRLQVAIETGTFLGDTTAFLAERCDRVTTIELDPGLAARARDRFSHRVGVTVLEGDSGKLLEAVLAGVDEPALFWLDGHFSGVHEGVQTARGEADTPLRSELETIVAWPHAARAPSSSTTRGCSVSPTTPRSTRSGAWSAGWVTHRSRSSATRW